MGSATLDWSEWKRSTASIPKMLDPGRPSESLTPIFPNRQVKLETDADNLTNRMIDLFSPIGLGQRGGLIVSPPKAGKTTVLKHIANGVVATCPEADLMVVAYR